MTGAEDVVEITTPVLVEELASGSFRATSLAVPEQIAFGTEADVLAQHRAYMEKALLTAGAEDVAQYLLPDGIELHRVSVAVERFELPRGLRQFPPFELACPVAAAQGGRYVFIPALRHAFSLSSRENLDEVVAGEVRRLTAAMGDEVLDLRRLLPARDAWIERVAVELLGGAKDLVGRARAIRKRKQELHRKRSASEQLEKVAVLLTSRGAAADRPPLVGRAVELERLRQAMANPRRGSVLVVGDELVGKSHLIDEWSRSAKKSVYATSIAQLVAGASGFGEWQERVTAVLEAAETFDAVLYFENLGELFGERAEQGGFDVAGLLRTWVVGGRVRILGELTPQALDVARRTHVALVGAMSEVRIEPLDATQTLQAVHERIAYWRKQGAGGVPVADEVAQPVVDLVARYMPYRAFPGKAIRFLEELRATRQTIRDADGEPIPIVLADCFEAFSLTSGIPGFLLREDRPLGIDELIGKFRERMIGQDEAVERVAQTICLVKARMQPAGKPLATFLFAGPTGVGKTELARTIAHYLFGSSERLVRFDMSEYGDPLAAERLIRGTVRADGLLTGRVRERPFCVLLLDEIEKAHPAVHDLLLQVCGEGRLTDARGRTTHFDNVIIIMTSNLGAVHRDGTIGIAAAARNDAERYARAVAEAFRPEMLNRIDRIVGFGPLSPDEVARVARLALIGIAERRGLQESGVAVDVSEAAMAALGAGGYSAAYGVRALRRHLDGALVNPLARLLSRLGREARGSLAWVGTVDETLPSDLPAKQRFANETVDDLRIELFRRPDTAGRRALGSVGRANALRRACDRLLAMDEAAEVGERVAVLRAELATLNEPRRRRKRASRNVGPQLAALKKEHHRLSSAWERASKTLSDVHEAEDLCIGALFQGSESRSWSDEVVRLAREFRAAFFWVLAAPIVDRDDCVVRVRRVNGSTGLLLWLGGLVRWGLARGWEFDVHVAGEAPSGSWPEDRAWGPPKSAEWLLGRLDRAADSLDRLLLVVRGPDCGVVLPHESGLHQFLGWSDREQGEHIDVTLVSRRSTLDDAQWTDRDLALPADRVVKKTALRHRTRRRNHEVVHVRTAHSEAGVDLRGTDYFDAIELVCLESILGRRSAGQLGSVPSYYEMPDDSDGEGGLP